MKTERTYAFAVYCDIEYSECPEKCGVTLTEQDRKKILHVSDGFLQDQDLDTVELRIGSIDYFDCDDKGKRIEPDGNEMWRTEGERIRIRSNGWSAVAYDKYNGWIYWTDYLPFHTLKEE